MLVLRKSDWDSQKPCIILFLSTQVGTKRELKPIASRDYSYND
jgi:hypothetical protein